MLTTPAPTPTPVSINLGSTAGSNTLGTYALTKVITSSTNDVAAANGLAAIGSAERTALASTSGGGGSQDNMAISVTDFNIFRIRVIDAINTLDAKIREIPALGSLTCT